VSRAKLAAVLTVLTALTLLAQAQKAPGPPQPAPSRVPAVAEIWQEITPNPNSPEWREFHARYATVPMAEQVQIFWLRTLRDAAIAHERNFKELDQRLAALEKQVAELRKPADPNRP